MKTELLFQSAMSGEQSSFEQWSSSIHAPIARFGYQNGVADWELEKFQLAVFQEFYSRLPGAFTEEAAKKDLYKIAAGLLASYSSEVENKEGKQVLRFEEDREIHQLLQSMDNELRIPFTLISFHAETVEDAALLLGKTTNEVQVAVDQILTILQKQLHFERREEVKRRVEFLEKSYNRFTPPFNETKIFENNHIDEELPEMKMPETKQKVKKGPVAIIGIATIFLLGVVGASFTMNEAEPETAAAVSDEGDVDSNTIKAWKAEYKKIKEASPKQLGLTPDAYENLEYVQKADAKFERLLTKSTLKKFKDDPQALRDRIESVLLDIKTPKNMYESLDIEGMSAKESMAFLQSFALKTKELMVLADGVLSKNKDNLAGAFRHGNLSAESLQAHKDRYPEDVRRLIDALDESMLMIVPHPKEAKFLARRNMELLYGNDLLFQDMFGYQYIALLENEPYFDDNDLLLPLESMPFQLTEMERFLVEASNYSNLDLDEFKFIFQHSFWLLLKGSEMNPVFDAEGKVIEAYQAAWQNLVSDTGNPLIYTVLPIVKEMEASGWRESAHYDALAYPDILNALEMEKNGELASKLPNGNIKVKPAFVDIQDFSYSQTKKLYTQFTKKYDRKHLKNHPPLDILFLYHYANERKDPETMWHLLAEDELKPSLADYKNSWKQQPDITKEALWIELYEGALYRRKEALYVEPQINYRSENAMSPPAPVLVTESENIWLIKNQMYEGYQFGDKTSAFEKNLESLYKAFSANKEKELLEAATPAEIGGLFLMAGEQGDFETMYELMEEPAKAISIESFRHQLSAREFPEFSSLKEIAFALDMYAYDDSQRRGWVRLGIGNGTEDSFEYQELAMVETSEGWRMGDMNNY